MCTCFDGYIGNAFVLCNKAPGKLFYIFEKHANQYNFSVRPINICTPSPCGPNSQCREINGQPVCSCAPGFIGSPPTCRPECITSSECPLNEACVNQKCINPCAGTCGLNSLCNVVNHNPICSCPIQMIGDPFTRCIPKRKTLGSFMKLCILSTILF